MATEKTTPAQVTSWRSWMQYVAWAQALIATMGSLFLSEVMLLPPCVLCWYQRILMYPLVVIIGVGILRRDSSWVYTALPLSILGWGIALYHSLLQWKILPENVAPCQAGISCTTLQINLLGFITIPFMSLVAFSVIIVATLLFMKGVRRES